MRLYVGFDPGRQGGWGIVDEEGRALYVEALPYTQNQLDIRTLENELKHNLNPTAEVVVTIEHPLAMSGESMSGHLNSGKNFGILIAICTLRGFVIHTPAPHIWKGKMSLSKDKGMSMKLCDQLFPNMHGAIRGPRGGALDGLAEGLLIAEYQRRIDGRRRGLHVDPLPSTGALVRRNRRVEGQSLSEWAGV